MNLEAQIYSAAVEDYVRAIYEMQGEQGKVATTQLAKKMGVASPSVTSMVKKLANLDLVDYEPYRGVALTPAGQKTALKVIRHHRLVESFLVQTLGMPWDQVHAEADRLEHALSDELEARIGAMLGQPSTDPHGAPIPTREGTVAHSDNVRLTDVEPGQEAVVAEVNDRDPSLLRYLGELGLYPGVMIKVVARAPFNGPLTIQIGKTDKVLGRTVAAHVLVTGISDSTD